MSFIQYQEIPQQMLCPGYLLHSPICPASIFFLSSLWRPTLPVLFTQGAGWGWSSLLSRYGQSNYPNKLALRDWLKGVSTRPVLVHWDQILGLLLEILRDRVLFPPGVAKLKGHMPVALGDHLIKKALVLDWSQLRGRQSSREEGLSSDDIAGTPGSRWANPRI